MLINMQLLPLKTFLVSSGLRSTLFLALCSGGMGVPNHLSAQPLAGRGNSESGSTRCPPTSELEVPVAALGRVAFFQAGVFMYGCFSLLDFRGSWSWVSAGKLFSTALWELWGSFSEHPCVIGVSYHCRHSELALKQKSPESVCLLLLCGSWWWGFIIADATMLTKFTPLLS